VTRTLTFEFARLLEILTHVLKMPKWSTESIIALITLLTTCIPISLLIWRTLKHRQRLARAGQHLYKGS
jgi:hypothetical protein